MIPSTHGVGAHRSRHAQKRSESGRAGTCTCPPRKRAYSCCARPAAAPPGGGTAHGGHSRKGRARARGTLGSTQRRRGNGVTGRDGGRRNVGAGYLRCNYSPSDISPSILATAAHRRPMGRARNRARSPLTGHCMRSSSSTSPKLPLGYMLPSPGHAHPVPPRVHRGPARWRRARPIQAIVVSTGPQEHL